MKAILALIVAMLVGLSFVEIAGANASSLESLPSIEIQSDGKVVPQNSPITQVGNTYYLTSDIYNKSIHIQKDNIILEGAGYKLQNRVTGGYPLFAIGVIFSGRTNIVIQNMIIEGFMNDISLYNSNKVLITNNTISDGTIALTYCHDCSIDRNKITKDYGILLGGSTSIQITNNTFSENINGIILDSQPDTDSYINIVGNSFSQENSSAIQLQSSSNVLISKNIIKDCQSGIQALSCKGNINVYYNDFIGNNVSFSKNQNINKDYLNSYYFDNGSLGNYWSSYNETDSNNDGIGDTPFTVAQNTLDHYPLVNRINQDQNIVFIHDSTQSIILTAVASAVLALVVIASIVLLYRRKHQTN